jgi:acetyltransferase-like isoleucine patch superfamily enzyme
MQKAGGRIAASSFVAESAVLELPVDIADNATIYGDTWIGAFTYINVGTVIYHRSRIGKFCSLGRQIEIGLARHPISFLSTHPFQVRVSPFERYPGYASVNRKPWTFHSETHIGNDVWIGAKACVVSGVSVGDGAVIAAGAIVTKDVEPYAIVGGVPAKVISRRFDQERVEALLDLRWWDLDLADLTALPFDDIDRCIQALRAIRESQPVVQQVTP